MKWIPAKCRPRLPKASLPLGVRLAVLGRDSGRWRMLGESGRGAWRMAAVLAGLALVLGACGAQPSPPAPPATGEPSPAAEEPSPAEPGELPIPRDEAVVV